MGIIHDDVTRQRVSYVYRWWMGQEETIISSPIDTLGYDATYFTFCVFIYGGGRLELQIQHSDEELGTYEDVPQESLVYGRHDGKMPVIRSIDYPYPCEGVHHTKRWLRVVWNTYEEPPAPEVLILAVTYAMHNVLEAPAPQDAPVLGMLG